jgi:hypothetical protein
MSDDFSVEFSMVRQAKDQLLELYENKPQVASLLIKNFINPLKLHYRTNELRGKYKPSWMIPGDTSNKMSSLFAQMYKDNACHHYHFGYPYYSVGRDPYFPGDESDGIVHTVFESMENSESHVLLRVDEAHPHPFSVPIFLAQQIKK